jgi:opacity protein-like surface antigen
MSLSASAQDNSRFDVFGGYSYLMYRPDVSTAGAPSSVNFNGGIGSLALNLNHWIGGVGEVAGYHASTITSTPGATINAITYLFGPKIFVSIGKISPFAQALFGGIHETPSGFGANEVSQNAFAMAVGGGLDWNAGHHIGVRLGQIEYLMTRFNNTTIGGIGAAGNGMQNSFRYSAGVVFRF